jgi:hypothetical protein
LLFKKPVLLKMITNVQRLVMKSLPSFFRSLKRVANILTLIQLWRALRRTLNRALNRTLSRALSKQNSLTCLQKTALEKPPAVSHLKRQIGQLRVRLEWEMSQIKFLVPPQKQTQKRLWKLRKTTKILCNNTPNSSVSIQ